MALQSGVKSLDDSVATAGKNRQAEHAEFQAGENMLKNHKKNIGIYRKLSKFKPHIYIIHNMNYIILYNQYIIYRNPI